MRNKTRLLIFALALAAFALRVYRLDFFSLRGDEAFTVIFVQRTWEGLWRGISTIEPNPPLMYLVLRVWVALAGASEFVTRYFSVFFGVACVPLLYRLAREIFASRVIALCAAALIAINPYQIWHAQDVRNYTMWPALSLLGLIFFWRWWSTERKQMTDDRRQTLRIEILDLGFFTLATLASLYTHYYDVFILVALNLFVFTFATLDRRWKTLARWVGAQMVLVALYAPWVLFGTNRITTYGEASAEQSVSLIEQLARTIAAFTLGDTMPAEFKSWLWMPLMLALAMILISLARQNRQRAAFIFLWLAIPSLCLWAISIGRPLFLERYLNGVAPAYTLAFACGIVAVWRHTKLRAASVLFFIGVSGLGLANYFFNPEYAKAPGWRELGQFIAARQQPGDVIVQNFNEMAPLYYRTGDIQVLTIPQGFFGTPADEKVLRQLNADYRRIWFIPALPGWWDPDQFVEKFLARNADRVLDTRVSDFRLQLYATPRELESKIIPVNARAGNATLVGYRVENIGNLHVVLYWRAVQPIDKDYSVFVHLSDASARVVAQQDRAPAFGLYSTTAWQPGESVIDAYDLQIDTSGKYSLIVGMYDPVTLARVPAFDSQGVRLPDDQIVLTQITVP